MATAAPTQNLPLLYNADRAAERDAAQQDEGAHDRCDAAGRRGPTRSR